MSMLDQAQEIVGWRQRRLRGVEMTALQYLVLDHLQQAEENDMPPQDLSNVHGRTLRSMVQRDWIVGHSVDRWGWGMLDDMIVATVKRLLRQYDAVYPYMVQVEMAAVNPRLYRSEWTIRRRMMEIVRDGRLHCIDWDTRQGLRLVRIGGVDARQGYTVRVYPVLRRMGKVRVFDAGKVA